MKTQPPPPAPLRAVVFDFDGTLVDSMGSVMDLLAEAVAPFRPRPTLEELKSFLGGPPERIVAGLLGVEAAPPEALERLDMLFRRPEAMGRLFDGAREILRSLASRGICTGLWTGRDRTTTLRMLRHHGLDACFGGAVLCGDDLPSHKPDPEGLLAIISRCGATPAGTVVVGDMDFDLLGARAAGARSILIEGHQALLHASAATWRVRSLPEAGRLLETL